MLSFLLTAKAQQVRDGSIPKVVSHVQWGVTYTTPVL
jgi:hypothetical protein